MWILHFLPDSFLYAVVISILFGGIGLYALGFFSSIIPPLYPYQAPIKFFAVLLIVLGVYFYGSYDTEMAWRGKVAELEKDLDAAIKLANEKTTEIVTQYVTETKVIHDHGTKIAQNIIDVAPDLNAKCTLTQSAIDLHNEATDLKLNNTVPSKPVAIITPSSPKIKSDIILPKKATSK